MKCTKCGRECDETLNNFCTACGTPLDKGENMPPASQIIAPGAVEPADRKSGGGKPPRTRRAIIILVVCLAAVAILAAALTASYYHQEREYQTNLELGYHYLSDGDYQEAVLSFEAAIAIHPRDPEPYVGRGDAYTGLEHYKDAQADYEQALELDNSLADAYLGLANALMEQGEEAQALRTLEEGAQLTNDPRLSQWLEALRSISGSGVFKGTVSEYLPEGGTALLPGARVRLYLTTTDEPRLARAATTDQTGAFSLERLAEGEYILHVDAPDHIGLEAAETLTDGEEAYTELFLLIPESQRIRAGKPGDFYATVTNAINGEQIPHVELRFRKGWNNWDGDLALEEPVFSDADGSVLIQNLDYGYYTVETKADGFSPTYHNVAVVPEEFYTEWNLPISPILEKGETRIILTWNEEPFDLDSHLTGSFFHVFYGEQDYYDSSDTHQVNLDLDDTDSYGPETITIYNGLSESCTYFVHDYTNSGDTASTALCESGATVRVYQRAGLVATFHVPTGIAGDMWTVFTIDADGNLTAVNSIGMADDWR